MVWDQGSGRTSNNGVDPFPTNDVMTAPFTSDPTKLQPRRLRSSLEGATAFNYAVGCGYAARRTSKNSLFVVRLKDGWSWLLPDIGNTPPRWSWDGAIAVTCEEVFALVDTGTVTQIARIRLDSLGAGMPPD